MLPCGHLVFICFPFLRVSRTEFKKNLLKTNWNLLARRRRYKCRHDMPKVARHADDDTICQWWYDIQVVVHLTVSECLKSIGPLCKITVSANFRGRYEISIPLVQFKLLLFY